MNRAVMKPHLQFTLPVLRPATARSFDIRPAALDAWLAQLPVANLGETCRQIFLALYEVNRTQQPPQQRLAFLERLAMPLALVLPSLQRHYIGQPFPLPEKAQQIARLAIDLQVELVIGYRLVLEGVHHQPWYSSWGQTPRKMLASHRMLHYLGGILSDYQWQHLPYPRSVWRTVHRIFRHEGHAGRIRRPVPPLAGAGSSVNVLDEYKRVLLRALVPLSRINTEQWQAVGEHLDRWLALVEFDPTSVEYGFWVRLNSDSPPTELPVDFSAAIRGRGKHTVLNTRRLVQYLEQLLAGPDTALPSGLERDSVKTLRNVWSGARGRHGERRQGRGQEVQVLIGLNTLYHALAGGSAAREHAVGKEIRPPSLQSGAKPTQPSVTQASVARVIDYSENGYGLSVPAATAHPIQEGDILGLRSGPAQPWEIGYVCWLRAVEGEPLALGVQHLAVEALPVAVLVGREGGHSTPLGCLLGSTATGETALFMPHLPDIEHKSLYLGYRGHAIPVTLRERIDGSNGFSAFLFDTPAQDEHAGLAAQEAWRQQVEAPVAAATEADRYAQVWHSL